MEIKPKQQPNEPASHQADQKIIGLNLAGTNEVGVYTWASNLELVPETVVQDLFRLEMVWLGFLAFGIIFSNSSKIFVRSGMEKLTFPRQTKEYSETLCSRPARAFHA